MLPLPNINDVLHCLNFKGSGLIIYKILRPITNLVNNISIGEKSTNNILVDINVVPQQMIVNSANK